MKIMAPLHHEEVSKEGLLMGSLKYLAAKSYHKKYLKIEEQQNAALLNAQASSEDLI